MPAKKKSTPQQRKARKELKEIEKEEEEIKAMKAELLEDDNGLFSNLPYASTSPMISLVIKGILIGCNAQEIKQLLYMDGYDTNIQKVYYLMRKGREKIAEVGEHDFKHNYAWIQQNLLDLHKRSIHNKNDRMRLVVLKELSALWGLNRQRVEVVHTEITPEMIEQFEQALLR